MYTPKQFVEIFHLIFLRSLEAKLDKKLYILKGGCNLRFHFKSIRYSEDIDLDVRFIAKETLRQKVTKLLMNPGLRNNLKAKGIEIIQFSEAKQTETTQRWKLNLRATGLSMPLPTKIEFSRRAMQENFAFEPVDSELISNYSLYPIMLNHYTARSAFNQKINALIHRTETQARDIFDLRLLIDKGISFQDIDPTLFPELPMAIENAMSVSFSDFKSQVVAYLLEEYQEYYSNDKAWQGIQDEVIKIFGTTP
jgi:predicted nucleotidyltransferase component of viral defense system